MSKQSKERTNKESTQSSDPEKKISAVRGITELHESATEQAAITELHESGNGASSKLWHV